MVKTVPEAGSEGVDPGLAEIKVTYSEERKEGNWSWSTFGMDESPEKPRYAEDRRTCVLPVGLKPGKTYALRLNSQTSRNFQDPTGRPAVPYLLVFKTGADEG